MFQKEISDISIKKFWNDFLDTLYPSKYWPRLASVAGAVIQAIGRPEFEDGLRTGVLLQDCYCFYSVCLSPWSMLAPF